MFIGRLASSLVTKITLQNYFSTTEGAEDAEEFAVFRPV